ncbi:LPD38 domain-containing protein, partial [Phascolarctobacterium faecium]|uniref:LPD38 domain-containing protein n=1 Tax=Phascolarctobacterium faecium TaxID=33025 RepID=UPI003FF04441
MSTAREKMLAKFANKPVLENKGFFQRAAERVTENYLNSQGEVEPSLEEQMEDVTAEERGKFFADAGTRIGEAIENFATGAVQGAQEVGRQANRLAAANPLALTGTPMQEGYTNAPVPTQTKEQEKAGELYKKATGNFAEETIAPAAMATALLAPSSFAAPVFSPFVLSSLQTNIEKRGAKGVIDTAAEFLPGAGVYQVANRKGAKEYAAARPGAFAVDVITSLAPDIVGFRIGGHAVKDFMPSYKTVMSSLLGETEKKAKYVASKILHNMSDNNKENLPELKMEEVNVEPLNDTRKVQGMLSKETNVNVTRFEEVLSDITKLWDSALENGDPESAMKYREQYSKVYDKYQEELNKTLGIFEKTKKKMDFNQSLPEVKLAIDEQNFAKNVDAIVQNTYKGDSSVPVMSTPLALELAGAEILPIEISPKNLKKITIGKHNVANGEGMTPEIVKQIPRALTDPIMIFDAEYSGKKGEKRIIAVLDLKDENGTTIVTPFELKQRNNKKGYEINEMLSAFGKDDKVTKQQATKWYEDNVLAGRLRYINKEKTAEWLKSARDEYPMLERAVDSSLTLNIPTEKDFVNLKNRKTEQYSLGNKSTGEEATFGRSGKTKTWGEIKPVTRKEVEAAFNAIVPVRVGGVDEKYKGLFKVGPEVVRSRAFADYATYSHEIGHFLDKKLEVKGSDAELIAGAENVWGNNSVFREYNNAEKRAEGIAEFTRQILADPEMAERNFPKYYENFIQALRNSNNKDLAKKFDRLADVMRRYSLQSDQARGRASISFADDLNLKSFTQKAEDVLADAYKYAVDDKDPINKFVEAVIDKTGKELPYEDNPYLLARSAASSAKSRSTMLLDDKGKPTDVIEALNKVYNNKLKYAVTLQDILKEVDSVKFSKDYLRSNGYKDNRQAFSTYLVAKRQLELQSIHKEYNGSMEKNIAASIVENAPKEFISASEKVHQHFDNVLSILEDSGIISKEQHNTLAEKYKNYVPMYRDRSMDDVKIPGYKPKSGLANVTNPIKGLNEYGSNRNVIDPLDSLIAYTQKSVDAAERNKVGLALSRLKDVEGIGSYLEERPDLEGKGSPENFVFTVWENGEKKSYQTAPELYDAMVNLSLPTFNTVEKVFMTPAEVMRAGATGTPAFGLFNLARDTLTSVLYSNNTTIPVIEPIGNTMYGLWEALRSNYHKKSSLYREFEIAGVPMTTRISTERSSLKWQKLQEAPGVKLGTMLYKGFQKLNQSLEEAARLGEFAAGRRKGKSIQEAGLEAKEITTDFSRGGSLARKYNRYVPFFNAAIQGTDRLIREVKAHPVRLGARVGTAIILPALFEWVAFHDEDWYQDVPQDIRDNYFIARIGDEIVKTPLPQEVAFLAGGFKRSLSKLLDDNPDAMNKWAANTLDTMLPDYIPAFMKPFIEWQSSYNFFTEKNIIPVSLQNLPDKE